MMIILFGFGLQVYRYPPFAFQAAEGRQDIVKKDYIRFVPLSFQSTKKTADLRL
jgi:hypothetical protein